MLVKKVTRKPIYCFFFCKQKWTQLRRILTGIWEESNGWSLVNLNTSLWKHVSLYAPILIKTSNILELCDGLRIDLIYIKFNYFFKRILWRNYIFCNCSWLHSMPTRGLLFCATFYWCSSAIYSVSGILAVESMLPGIA